MEKSDLSYDWVKYDHDYAKAVQDIKLKNGMVVYECYPNAGQWMTLVSQPGYKVESEISDKEVEYVRLAKSNLW